MVKENVRQFFNKAEEDLRLQKALKEIIVEGDQHGLAQVVKLGAETGFTFNESALREIIAETVASIEQNGELNDSELEAVAGGNQKYWDELSKIQYTLCVHSAINRCNPKDRLLKLRELR